MKVAILSTFALFYSASLTLATETGCAIVLKTSDGFLNLREGPGTQFRVIAKLNRDDFLYVGTEQCYAGHCTDERHSWTRLEGLPRLNRHRLGKRQLYPVGRLSRELPGLWAVRRPSGRLVELQFAAKRKRSDQRCADVGLFRELLTVMGKAFDQIGTYTDAQPSTAYLCKLLESDQFIALAALEDQMFIGGLAAYELLKFEQERSEIYIYDLAARSIVARE